MRWLRCRNFLLIFALAIIAPLVDLDAVDLKASSQGLSLLFVPARVFGVLVLKHELLLQGKPGSSLFDGLS